MAEEKSSKGKKDLAGKIEKDIGRTIEKIAGTTIGKKLSKKNKRPYYYLGVLLIVIVAAIFVVAVMASPGVEIGDKVTLTYVGTFENGTLFDNNTIDFRVGDNTLLPGFEYGIIGMKPGEQKNVIVEPEYGYGVWSTDLLEVMEAEYTLNKYFDLSMEVAEAQTKGEIKVGNTVTLKDYMWMMKVTDIDREFGEVRFEHKPTLNSIYYNPLLVWWPVRIMEIQDSKIIVRHEPKIGSSIRKGTGQKGVVINADEESVVVDYNHAMAGKTLIFDVKIHEVD
mgnify:CR=1 FL=1|tara:strand:+ start:2033 stop:2872 length:840 start_codon:yes stop_codon:yes gene_type:complete